MMGWEKEAFDDQIFICFRAEKYRMDFEVVGRETNALMLRGHVRWDGCMNWETVHPMMYHFCSIEDAKKLTRIFSRVWELGAAHIEEGCELS